MKICPNCGHPNADDMNFCENCGTKLINATKICPRCQASNPSDSHFCESCGYDFATTDNKSSAATNEIKPTSVTPTPQSVVSTAPKSAAADQSAERTAPTASTTNTPSKTETAPHQQAVEHVREYRHKSKWQWVLSAVILLILIGGGAYLLTRDAGHAAKPTINHPAKKAASSQATSKSASSAAITFDQNKIEDDVTTALNGLSGTTSVYVSPVDQSQTVLVNNGAQSSASSIKVFILVTAYAMAKEGVFNLDDTHTLTSSEKVGGTGELQNMATGTKLTYREILGYMIDHSDNTAANIIIDKLGGFDLINNKIKSMGATSTKLRRKMMDTDAIDDGRDNTTSARDLGVTLKKIYNHQLVSKSADTEMLDILAKNTNHNKLPKSLPSAAKVYNKTGEFSDYGVQNDAEIVANRHGAFVAVVLAENGQETDQVAAMNDLGLKLYQDILE